MSLKKNRGGKKNKLEGAIRDELTDSIMSDFIHNIKNDKADESAYNDVNDNKGVKKNMREDISMNLKQSRSLPMIRNTNNREWWISLAAFATIVAIILLLVFAPFGTAKKYQVKLTSKAADSSNISALPDLEAFNIGDPIYVYFVSNKALNVKKIFIRVLSLSESASELNMSTLESNINPKWKSIETHFQKEYFEMPGKYKIKIESEEGKILTEKTFSIR